MIAHVCTLHQVDFVHTLGDAHVYFNHIQPLNIQVCGL
ncbi:Thymidylate synthase [Geodia barretti]|uniref:Thymidylate synthase n=1 Tax=Geodia barretti TaxID=519541 RepID=A0AA35U1U1_GEOBA|nr:Thymidylate synthase [Geodia barretti]